MPDDDGGLGEARAAVTSERAAVGHREQTEHEMVEQALKEQFARLQSAITAFLKAAQDEGVEPEPFVVGHRQTGPAPKARFGRNPRGEWGFHAQPAPTEPIYDYGYTVHHLRQPRGEGYEEETVILWQSERIEGKPSQSSLPRKNTYKGILDFHRSARTGLLYPGAVADGLADRVVEDVRGTADWLVKRLADYLETHRNAASG